MPNAVHCWFTKWYTVRPALHGSPILLPSARTHYADKEHQRSLPYPLATVNGTVRMEEARKSWPRCCALCRLKGQNDFATNDARPAQDEICLYNYEKPPLAFIVFLRRQRCGYQKLLNAVKNPTQVTNTRCR